MSDNVGKHTTDQDGNLYRPAVPDAVRTVVYVVGLAVGALAILAGQVGPVWWPEASEQIDATVQGVTKTVLFIAGALGVAYRPTRRVKG